MILMTTFSMCSTLNFLCLQLANLLIDSCDADGMGGGGARVGGGSWGGSRRGGRGFRILGALSGDNKQNGNYEGGDDNIYTYLEPIIILLLLILSFVFLFIVYKWVRYCHKLVHHPEKLTKKDPDQFQKDVIARYQALQNKFRNDLINRQQGDNRSGIQFPNISTISSIYPIENFPPTEMAAGENQKGSEMAWTVSSNKDTNPYV